MGKILKLVAANVLVFIALCLAILLIVSVTADTIRLAKSFVGSGDKRGRDELPMYAMDDTAPRIFDEQSATVSVYVPITGWQKEPFKGEFVNIDENGRRTHTSGTENNRADAKTIGFFGGSTMWGTGVADNGTIPAHFDRLTDAYRVINYGQRGWRSRQNLAQLINLYNQGQLPDIAVFYDGGNDPLIGCDLGFGTGYNETHQSPYLRDLIRDRENPSYLYRNFYVPAWTTFLRISKLNKVASDRRCDVDPERARQVAETMFLNWKLAKAIMEANGGKFYGFLQPVAGMGSPNIEYLDLNPGKLAQYPPVYPLLREKIAREGAGWAFDISDAFDGSGQYYIDDLHVSTEGNEIVAKRMRDAM